MEASDTGGELHANSDLLHNVLRLSGSRDDTIELVAEQLDTKAVLELSVVLKNARSLASDYRIEEMLIELENVHWDFIFIHETWRLEAEEEFCWIVVMAGLQQVAHGDTTQILASMGLAYF